MDHPPAETQDSSHPRRARRRSPKLREASFQDYAQIALLESRYGLTAAATWEEWSHLWLGNPLYQELQPGWSIGWVLEDEHNRVVGSLGSIPRLFELGGTKLVAATSRGWVAEPEYRSASLLLLDQLINHPRADLFVTNTNSAASTPAVAAFCSPVPVGLWNEYVFWITNYRDYTRRSLARQRYPWAKTLSYPLSAIILLRDWLGSKSRQTREVEIEVCESFDDRFDEFWSDLRKRSQHLLLAVRTREVLEWHYKYGLLSGRVWIVAAVDGHRIVAYAIYDKKEYPSGLKQVRLVDFQSLDHDTGLLEPLLSWALRKCRDEGIHRLVSIGRWLEAGECLEKLAPYRRRLPAWVYFYRTNSPKLAETLKDRSAWAPSLFDGDAGLLR